MEFLLMAQSFSNARDLFFAAASDSSFWPAAMDAVAETTGAYGAALLPLRCQLPNFARSGSLEQPKESTIEDHRLHSAKGPAAIKEIGVATEFDFIKPDEIADHPFYESFLAQHKLRWFAGAKIQAGEDLWYLSIQRTIHQGPFSLSEQQEFANFSESLTGVCGLARAIRIGRAEGALAAFDASGTAVALFDCRGLVWRVNLCAKTILGSGLTIVNRRLISDDRNAMAELDRAVSEVLWSPGVAVRKRPVQFPRPNKRPIVCYPLRLSTVTSDAYSPCQVAIVLNDLETKRRPFECDLRACFDLSAAEANLAIQITSGEDLFAICNKNGISRETARTQLRSVFAKTSVHRQLELAVLLINLTTLAGPMARPRS